MQICEDDSLLGDRARTEKEITRERVLKVLNGCCTSPARLESWLLVILTRRPLILNWLVEINVQPIRSTTQILVVTGHQYGRISALVSHISFCVKTVLVELRNADCFPLPNERRLYARTSSFTRDHSLLVSLIMKNDFKSSNYIITLHLLDNIKWKYIATKRSKTCLLLTAITRFFTYR